MNFGEYVFEQTTKHVDSFAVKLPISFPCLITRIILNQHPEVFHPQETPNKNVTPLTLDKKLFTGTYVLYIVMTKHQGQIVGGNSPLVSKETRKGVLLELIKVSKAMKETITASTIKKWNMDGLIKILTNEKDVEDEEKSKSREE